MNSLKKILAVTIPLTLAASDVILSESLLRPVKPKAEPALTEQPVISTSTPTLALGGSSAGTVTMTLPAVGTVSSQVVVGNSVIAGTTTLTWVGSQPTPRLTISCDETSCNAYGSNMEQARDVLERIANRGMRINVTVDQNCHPQHETIEPRQDLVASR